MTKSSALTEYYMFSLIHSNIRDAYLMCILKTYVTTLTAWHYLPIKSAIIKSNNFGSFDNQRIPVHVPILTSNSAVTVLAFLLTSAPTALKFLSRRSAYNSSEEFNMTFLGSVGTPPSSC